MKKRQSVMKFCFLITILLVNATLNSQSPYLSVLVKMDSVKSGNTYYRIEIKICEIKNSKRGELFSHDTSKINFDALKPVGLSCGKYFDSGSATLIPGKEAKKPANQFEFANQLFAWEHVFVYKISNMSTRDMMPDMYIVVPIKYKSFRTRLSITEIEFRSGKVIFLTDLEGSYGDKELFLSQSLKSKKGIDIKNFFLKDILK